MSSAILRRNSSKKGLEKLLRMTTQRSMEDAEEIERERRRRERASRQSGSSDGSPGLDLQTDNSMYHGELKRNCATTQDEDEGFSDWTHRLDTRRKRHEEHHNQTAEEPRLNGATNHVGLRLNCATNHVGLRLNGTATHVTHRLNGTSGTAQPSVSCQPVAGQRDREATGTKTREDEKEEKKQRWREGQEEVDVQRLKDEKASGKKGPEQTGSSKVPEKRKELRISYVSRVSLQQEVRNMNRYGETAGQEEETKSECDGEETAVALERRHMEQQQNENEEQEQEHRVEQAPHEEPQPGGEEKHSSLQEQENSGDKQEQRQSTAEEERQRRKEEIGRKTMEAMERRMKRLSSSSIDADEPFSPLSPTFKNEGEERLELEGVCSITERTESLNRSLKKSNSIKKTQAPVVISKIDDRLQQYHHAVEESAKEAKAAKSALVDMPSTPEPVASYKSFFDGGDAWNQNSVKTPPSKDTEGLKVGVADLITQWVRVPDGNSKTSPSTPSEVKPGDVQNKKSLWETLGDSVLSERAGTPAKGSSGKRYKFVVTGHGKYEKVLVDDNNEHTKGNSESL